MSNQPFADRRPGWMAALVMLLLLSGLQAVLSSPATAQTPTAGRTALSDDFSGPGNWMLPKDEPGAVSFGNGRIVLLSRPGSENAVSVARALLLSPAASYRVSAELTVPERFADTAFAGISLQSPSGDAVRVRLMMQSQQVWIAYRHNGQAMAHLMPATVATALLTEPGATNTLLIESGGGRFSVSVNGVAVGTSQVVDFTPTRVQLVAGDLKAEFAKLRVTETGLDTRQARLLQLLPVPGQRTLAQDTLKGNGLGRALSILGVGKATEEPDWTKPFNNEQGRFERDTGRGRLLLEAKTAAHAASSRLSSYDPLPGASYAVSARVHLLRMAKANDCAGVFVEGPAQPSGGYDIVMACVNAESVMLWHFDAQTDAWKSLAEAELAVPAAKAMDLRLVVTNHRVVALVDGRVHASAAKPAGFAYDGVGLRADPGMLVEVSEFKAHEL